MRVAQVVGKVVLSRVHPLLIGSQFKIVVPFAFVTFPTGNTVSKYIYTVPHVCDIVSVA